MLKVRVCDNKPSTHDINSAFMGGGSAVEEKGTIRSNVLPLGDPCGRKGEDGGWFTPLAGVLASSTWAALPFPSCTSAQGLSACGFAIAGEFVA